MSTAAATAASPDPTPPVEASAVAPVATPEKAPANDNAPGLSEGQKAQFPVWMQEELARMNRSANGNIMEVTPVNLEISARILETRQDLTAQLAGDNQQIINALVTEEMKAKIEHFLAHVHETETGHHMSEKQAAKEASRRMYGESALGGTVKNILRRIDPSYVGRARGGPDRQININSLAALNERIEQLEREIAAPRRLLQPYQEHMLRAEFHGLEELRKEWVAKEKEIRTQALLAKDSNFRTLNERWGFVSVEQSQNPDGTPRDSLADIEDGRAGARNNYTPEQVMTLGRLQQNKQLENLYLDYPRFDAWIREAYRRGEFSDVECAAMEELYAMPEFRTYRSLASAVKPEELRNWRATEEGRLLFMMLSTSLYEQDAERTQCLANGLPPPPDDLTLLSGGTTYPNGVNNPIDVVGVMQELQEDPVLANLNADLAKAERQRNNLRAKLYGEQPGPVLGSWVRIPGAVALGNNIRDRADTLRTDMEEAQRLVEARKKHLEIIREGKVRKLQEEWNEINNQHTILTGQVNMLGVRLGIVAPPPGAPAPVLPNNAQQTALANERNQLVKDRSEIEKSRRTKETEMRQLYEQAGQHHTPPATWPAGTPFAAFEGTFNAGIFNIAPPLGYGVLNPNAAAVETAIRTAERAHDDAKNAFDAVGGQDGNVHSLYQAAEKKVQDLTMQRDALVIDGARVDRIPKRVGVEEFHTRLRAKKIEVALCAQMGLDSTARLSADQRKQCRAEAEGMITVQKETLRAGEYGKKIENNLATALDNRLLATRIGPHLRKRVTSLPHDALHAAHHAGHWLFAEHHGHRRVTAPARLGAKVAGGLFSGFAKGVKKLAA